MGKDKEIKKINGEKELFYEYSIQSAAQFQRYGVTFVNHHSHYSKDVTFALKLIKVNPSSQSTIMNDQSPVDAGQTEEEAALFSYLKQTSTELSHFMTEAKFQNIRQNGYISNVRNSTESTLYLTVLEIAVMIGLGIFQVYYLKKVLENKRMI